MVAFTKHFEKQNCQYFISPIVISSTNTSPTYRLIFKRTNGHSVYVVAVLLNVILLIVKAPLVWLGAIGSILGKILHVSLRHEIDSMEGSLKGKVLVQLTSKL
jgi:hypothetical protein